MLLDQAIQVMNTHVVENEYILLDSLRHAKTAPIAFLDSRFSHLVNVSQIVESVNVSQSLFPKSEKLVAQVVFGNDTFYYSHIYDASLELYSYFKGISIESRHLKTVANQLILVFMWIFYILNYSFDLVFKVCFG